MILNDLLEGVRVTKLYSAMYGKMVLTQDVSVQNVRYDSRKVQPGDMFVALKGNSIDGHHFIDEVIDKGAVAVVVDDDKARPDSLFMHAGVLKLVVPDTRVALAKIAANYYARPGERLTLVGVTGTNGKTTTTHLVRSILEAHGEFVGLIGTIEYRVGHRVVEATHTTPESLEINALLMEMVDAGCSSAVMEVSSHALAMHRVEGLRFGAAVFTNLTQDHLDFHKTMESYFQSKRSLFNSLQQDAVAIINTDDPYGNRMLDGTMAKVITYGTRHGADVLASNIELSLQGSQCTITHKGKNYHIISPLVGKFNVANILAAFATGIGLDIPAGTIAEGIAKVSKVRGRFEQIQSPEGWTAIVDYAHTPDALENCLQTIHEIAPVGKGHKLITVFGCGGNRDKGKRPIMGRIASGLSDLVIVTSDNPRNEEPQMIVSDIVSGCVKGGEIRVEVDRRTAIRVALSSARKGDIVLIAGKGHETCQIVGEVRHHFDDREEVEIFIQGQE